MTTVIAVTSHRYGGLPAPHHTPTARVLTHPARQSLDDALTEMRMLLEQHGHVIVLYTSAVDPVLRQRVHAVRSVLESDRIALVETELPPLAHAVLVRQLRQLSTADLSPGVLAGSIRLLSHYIHAGALLNSVAKLDNVPVSVKAHARSWVPGSKFAVLASPTTQLVKVGGGGDLLNGPEYSTCLTTAAGNLNSDWVSRVLAGHWRVAALESEQLPRESARWWGTSKLIEFAAAIPEISLLYQVICSVQRSSCYWCGLELIGDHCVFCLAPAGTNRSLTPPRGSTTPTDARPRTEELPISDALPIDAAPSQPATGQPSTAGSAPPQTSTTSPRTELPGGEEAHPAQPAPPQEPPPHAASQLTQARTTRLTPRKPPFDSP